MTFCGIMRQQEAKAANESQHVTNPAHSRELKIADATKATSTGTEVWPWFQFRPGLKAVL